MNKNQNWRRVLSLLFAMVMLVSIMVIGTVVASADEAEAVAETGDVAMVVETGETYPTLKAAINACNTTAGTYNIKLLADVTEDLFVLKQKSGVIINVDGTKSETENFTFKSQIQIGAGSGNLNFTNVKFVPTLKYVNGTTSKICSFVFTESTAPNLTVKNCAVNSSNYTGQLAYCYASSTTTTITVKDTTATGLNYLVEVRQGGTQKIVVEDVTATEMMYFLRPYKAQNVTVKNVTCSAIVGIEIQNLTGNTGNVVVENCNFESIYYGDYYPPIRSYKGTEGVHTFTFSGINTFTKDNGEAWAEQSWISVTPSCVIDIRPCAGVIDKIPYETPEAFAEALQNLGGKHEEHEHNIILNAHCDVDFDIGEHNREDEDEYRAVANLTLNGYKYTGTISLHNKSEILVKDLPVGEVIDVIACDENITRVWNEDNHWYSTRHDFTNNSETIPPTCTEPGYITYQCNNCDHFHKVADNRPATGHTAGTAAKENVEVGDCVTDTEYDLVVRCTTCNEVLSSTHETEPSTGEHDFQFVKTVAAQIGAEGYDLYECANCDAYEHRNVKPALTAVATVNGVEYATLQGAINAAQTGETVYLVANVTENVTIKKSIKLDGKLDGSNKEYTGTITVNAGYTITIQNVKFVNGGIDKPKAQKSTTGVYNIYDCTFDGEGVYPYALRFYGAKEVNIKNCVDVKNYKYSFLYVPSAALNVNVYNVTVDNCPNYAVYFASGVTNATFEKFTVKNGNNGFIINNTADRSFTIKNCKMVNVGTAIKHDSGTDTITCTVLGNENDFGTAGVSQYAKLLLGETTATLKASADLAVSVHSDVKKVHQCYTAQKNVEGVWQVALVHTYNAVVTDPDCVNGGYTTYTCACGETYTDNATDALGHDYDAVVTPPTFDAQGYTTHTCANCGDSYTDSYVDALVAAASVNGEKYGTLQAAINAAQNGDTVVLESNLELGMEDAVLTYDNRPVLVKVDGKAITLDMNEKTIKATYTATDAYLFAVIYVEEGSELTVTGNGTIDAVAHETNPMIAYLFWTRGTNGVLTIQNGYYHMNNSADSMVYTNTNWKVTVNGGTFIIDAAGDRTNGFPCIFNTYGQNEKKIVVKGGSFNTNINAQYYAHEVWVDRSLALSYNAETGLWDVVTAKAFVAHKVDGYTRETGYATYAEACAAAKAGETVFVPNVKGVRGSALYLGNTIGIYFIIDENVILDGYTYSANIYLGNKLVTKYDFADWNKYLFNGAYAVLFDGIAAKQMTDEFTIEIVCNGYSVHFGNYETAENGTAQATPVKTSVRGIYDRGMAANIFDDNTIPMLTALLNYGGAAQDAFGYNTNNKADAGIAENETHAETNSDSVANGKYYGASLNLNSSILFNFKFLADQFETTEGLTAVVSYKTYDENGALVTVSVEVELQLQSNGKYLVALFDTFNADDAAGVFTCEIKNGTEVLASAQDSVLNYCGRALAGIAAAGGSYTGKFGTEFYQALADYVAAVGAYNKAINEVEF